MPFHGIYERSSDSQKKLVVWYLCQQRSRGGVSLDTERWGLARVVSRLTLGELRAEDAGVYECAAVGASDTVTLTLDDDGKSPITLHDASQPQIQRHARSFGNANSSAGCKDYQGSSQRC